jgi:agmatine deiminase
MKQLILALACACALSACGRNTDGGGADSGGVAYYLPGDWEPQSAIWFGWPTYENVAGVSSEELHAEMIRAIVPHTPVHMAAQSEAEIERIREFLVARGLSEQELEQHVSFHVIPHNDLWFRDTGGVFMRPVNGKGKQQVIDFNFNTWGFGFLVAADKASVAAEMLDEGVDRGIASALSLPTIKTELYAEGGAFSSNGKGTILAPERVMKQRNPHMSLEDMESELLRVFSADKIIWLPGYAGTDRSPVDGPYIVDGEPVYSALAVGGHLDEIARFVSEDTVLIPIAPSEEEAAASPIVAQSRDTILEQRAILAAATTADGKPIKIKDFVEPAPIFQQMTEGDGVYDFYTLMDMSLIGQPNVDPTAPINVLWASSYMNYVVTNDVVLVAKYADENPDAAAVDAEAKTALEAAFPGRTVVQIHPKAFNVGGGGMHCVTLEMWTAQ